MDESKSGVFANQTSRRTFLKSSAVAGGGLLLTGLDAARFAHAAGSDAVKIAVVGCGGRGTGAVANAFCNATNPNVKLVAMADAFREKIDKAYHELESRYKDKVAVPENRKFVGLDAWEKAIATDADIVLLCTPPGFRPMQFEAAVKARKHVFMEKPVAIDGPGFRQIQQANQQGKNKGLLVAVGHHLRHARNHRDIIKQIHEGLIGDVMYTQAFFNTGGIWNRERKPDMTEMQYQVNNWYHFVWLSGDHIVEQHVHGIDVCNWFAKGHPVEAIATGGRQVRIQKGIGELFDHFSVQYTYANGTRSFSECRHIPGCWSSFAHHAHGTKGSVSFDGNHDDATITLHGEKPRRLKGGPDGHQTEWDDLMVAYMEKKPYNELDWAADSTMTAILGRMAAYSGKLIKWEDAVKSELSYGPDRLGWDVEPKSKPGPDGVYPCATPGVTQAI